MFGINWASVGNYTIAIIVTAAILLSVFHFSTKGRMWKTFNNDQYKCGMVQILASDQTPNLTGLYASPTEASTAVLNCNTPQAFTYGDQLCTLHNGKYVCYPEPKNGKPI